MVIWIEIIHYAMLVQIFFTAVVIGLITIFYWKRLPPGVFAVAISHWIKSVALSIYIIGDLADQQITIACGLSILAFTLVDWGLLRLYTKRLMLKGGKV